MYLQSEEKLSQFSLFLIYIKGLWYIIANYEAHGQRTATSLRQIKTHRLRCYWFNVQTQNSSNQKNIFLLSCRMVKGNISQAYLTITKLIFKANILISKWINPMSSRSFNPLSIYSNRQSTPFLVYLYFQSIVLVHSEHIPQNTYDTEHIY